MDAKELGYRLARNRMKSGLTQARVAELMGTKQPAVSRVEQGRSVPSLEWIERFVAATGRRLEVDIRAGGIKPWFPSGPPIEWKKSRRRDRWDEYYDKHPEQAAGLERFRQDGMFRG